MLRNNQSIRTVLRNVKSPRTQCLVVVTYSHTFHSVKQPWTQRQPCYGGSWSSSCWSWPQSASSSSTPACSTVWWSRHASECACVCSHFVTLLLLFSLNSDADMQNTVLPNTLTLLLATLILPTFQPHYILLITYLTLNSL